MITQSPAPGQNIVVYKGDTIAFEMSLAQPVEGRAYLRTTLGRGSITGREIIEHVEQARPFAARDWHDVRMRKVGETTYRITMPLAEVGIFKAKCLFIPSGENQPLWPEGGNTVIKTEPSISYAANTIYSAFVRQFGPNKSRRDADQSDPAVEKLESVGYTVIPPSGKFRDLAGELDFIIGEMGFRIIQLLPIHPVPTTYARMGRFGSPFAALDLMGVDSALADFDQSATPLGQFRELVSEIHSRGAKVFLDMPINHTGWASKMQNQHPEWFARDENDAFESPGAWGITWEDLVKLSYRNLELWKYVADVFLFWRRQGVNGFRCDAGYMLPFMVWEYVVAKVRREYPDTIFILEGLGGKIETTESLIGEAGLNWAYSELFQNYDRQQIESYLPLSIRISETKGSLVHFSETHDNNRLASKSKTYARMRTALAALCSHNGAFGIANGVEWFADKKIDVHGAPSLNWGAEENQVQLVSRLNKILEGHPAFRGRVSMRLVHTSRDNTIAVLREPEQATESLILVLANLDDDRQNEVWWKTEDFDATAGQPIDLVSGDVRGDFRSEGDLTGCVLREGEVVALSLNESDLKNVDTVSFSSFGSSACMEQCMKAIALDIITRFGSSRSIGDLDLDAEGGELADDPFQFCRKWKTEASYEEIISWAWPRDARKVAMLPPGGAMIVTSDSPFVFELKDREIILQRESSVQAKSGEYFAVVFPSGEFRGNRKLYLHLSVYENGSTQETVSPLLQLARNLPEVSTVFSRDDAIKKKSYALCTNGKGAMAQVRAEWPEIRSQYDAMLAANLDPDRPTDPHVMLTRCRAWIVNQGYWQALNADFMETFAAGDGRCASWEFRLPCGRGKFVRLTVTLELIQAENAVALGFYRHTSRSRREAQEDSLPVDLIIRPDIEDRSCHEKTKAFRGLEEQWPGKIDARQNGFAFVPHPARKLDMECSEGNFVFEPEWTYMVAHPLDGERGLDDCSDLFGPGYFKVSLKGGQTVNVCAAVNSKAAEYMDRRSAPCDTEAHRKPIVKMAKEAISNFIVEREGLKTVIAGYPWFLDWGRDTLICLRGMIAAGMLRESEMILRQFARFEEGGTLPNVIYGNDASNRDTSDAPLWFIVALADYVAATGKKEILDADCGGRTMRRVMDSIIGGYMAGTQNGIKMDSESLLIFSPSHFTWMDTNYPAGSPREGYPIEIQALWYRALSFALNHTGRNDLTGMADKVAGSILEHYWNRRLEGSDWLSDCLHAGAGQSARDAAPDDALRPNQLLAVTMEAVKDGAIGGKVISSCAELLVPGAIRSLADRPVKFPISVGHEGRLLNNPERPYWGNYSGDEDTRRKPAYHNGTAWSWLFPSYCEAVCMIYGKSAAGLARSVLASSAEIMESGCIGQIPEILDGDFPHRQKGCGAQAWSATELYRVLASCEEN